MRKQLTFQQAKVIACRKAMADLYGCSEPPEGIADNYPFNAVAFLKTLPEVWRADINEAIAYVYHHEHYPPDLDA